MKLLLTSVFGPFGVDDAYGRKENVMELFHNQVTREQGVFSLRYHHSSYGLHFLAENVTIPTTVLDFPSEERFIAEIRKGYDYVGISFIAPNLIKAQRMARLLREHAPKSRIILGGHGTRIPGIEQLVEHDHLCQGEGVYWLRRLLGEEPNRPVTHPAIMSTSRKRILGAPVQADTAVLVPGVGCPNACRFCVTSHFFDKTYYPYFDSGKALFDVCAELEKKVGSQEFFVLDENFLKRPARARELLALMEKHDKPFRFNLFSSAETIASLGVEFLARLGVGFVWIGVESKKEVFEKNRGIDVGALIEELRDHGISVLASGILFLEHHDKETLWEDIAFVSGLGADFVQFMQLGPLPPTALYEDYERKGLLLDAVPYEERHGQHRLWFSHPNFTAEESATLLKEAFQYDYDTQGPSLLRICDTAVRGYQRLARYDDRWMKVRRAQLRGSAESYRRLLPTIRALAHNEAARTLADEVIGKYRTALGRVSVRQRLEGGLLQLFARGEQRRVAAGLNVYQPPTVVTEYGPGRRAKATAPSQDVAGLRPAVAGEYL
jgi:hypothetical protein